MKEVNETLLVQEALAGKPGAFDAIVDRYYRIVFSAAMKMVNNTDDAADITQNVFVKIYLNLRQFNPQYKLFSWIYRSAMNEALNFTTRERRSESLTESIVAPLTPDLVAQQAETAEKVQAAMMKLKPEYRAVMVAIHFQGLSYREAADVLEIPEKTVKSRLFSSRQMLKDFLITDGVVEP
jgi:RNA polymerase sigma-70 factor, ECF subfamily